MKCQYCGQEIKEDAHFCKYCGAAVETDTSNNDTNTNTNNNYQYQYNNQYNNYYYNDESIRQAYVGPKYDQLMNSNFSWPTFLFGPLYFFYRKMYLFGFVYLFFGTGTGIEVIINIIVAFCFKSIYNTHVNNKVREIKNNYPNSGNSELCSIAEQKGGTSPGALIIIIFFYIMLFVLLMFMFALSLGYDGNYNYNSNIRSEEKYKQEQISIESLQITVPNDFKKTTSTNSITYRNNDGCSINTYISNYTKSFNSDNYKEVEINGYVWYQKDTSTKLITSNTYETTFEGSTFTVRFYCPKDKTKNNAAILEKARDSMTFKKVVKEKITSNLKYTIPNGYKLSSENSSYYSYNAQIRNNESCYIRIYVTKDSTDETTFNKTYGNSKYYKSLDINNQKWYIKNGNSTNQEYITLHNGKKYSVSFNDYYNKRQELDTCKEGFKKFEDSLIFEDDL